jgi:hypothetical protein
VFAWGKADGVTGTRRFVVDAADQNNLEIARSELHNLLKKQDGKENPLAGIPLLVRLACLHAEARTAKLTRGAPAPRQVLGNKKDLPGALTERELIDRMDLQSLAQARAAQGVPCRCNQALMRCVRASGARGVHVLHFMQERGEHRHHHRVADEARAQVDRRAIKFDFTH